MPSDSNPTMTPEDLTAPVAVQQDHHIHTTHWHAHEKARDAWARPNWEALAADFGKWADLEDECARALGMWADTAQTWLPAAWRP